MAEMTAKQMLDAYLSDLENCKTPEGVFDPVRVAELQAKYQAAKKPSVSFEVETEKDKEGNTVVRHLVKGLKKGPPLKMSASELRQLVGDEFRSLALKHLEEYEAAANKPKPEAPAGCIA